MGRATNIEEASCQKTLTELISIYPPTIAYVAGNISSTQVREFVFLLLVQIPLPLSLCSYC
jgi:hypothetical protein